MVDALAIFAPRGGVLSARHDFRCSATTGAPRPVHMRADRAAAGSCAVPFVHGASLAPFLAFCNRKGIPTRRHLERAQLPATVDTSADMLLPLYCCYRFIDSVIRRESLPDFGLAVARESSPFDLGHLGEVLRRSRTLADYLRAGAQCTGSLSNSGLAIALGREGADLRVSFAVANAPGLGPATADLHALCLTLRTLRAALGEDWAPREIRLRAGSERLLQRESMPLQSRLIPGQTRTSFTLDRALLSRPLWPDGGMIARRSRPHGSVAPPPPLPQDFLASIDMLVEAMLGDGAVDTRRLAAACGVSSRALQRRLAELGTSFRDRLLSCRIQRARDLLADTDSPVAEIAAELGYTDSSNFARAFGRMTGQTPIEYRRSVRLRDSADAGSSADQPAVA